MSETNAPEPTMEEILASIRRIISEDDTPGAAADAATPPGDPPQPPMASAPEPAPEPARHEPEDVLELTEKVPEAPPPPPAPPPAAAAPAMPESLGDIDFADGPSTPSAVPEAARPATPPPRPAPLPAASPASGSEEPLVSAGAAGRAADHFGALASSMAMPASGRTLEDVVRELLRPLLKDWLDQHLATIVEARVQDEVERISRRRTY